MADNDLSNIFLLVAQFLKVTDNTAVDTLTLLFFEHIINCRDNPFVPELPVVDPVPFFIFEYNVPIL